jgi:hypothetical protein
MTKGVVAGPTRWKSVISYFWAKSPPMPPAAGIGDDSELVAESRKIGGSTPVPTVAMDCGLLESRLDRLDGPGPSGAGTGLNPAVQVSRID